MFHQGRGTDGSQSEDSAINNHERVSGPSLGHGRVVLAAPCPVAVDAMALHAVLEMADPGARETHEALRALELGERAADVVRQVDGKAGIAPGDGIGEDMAEFISEKVRR